MAKNEISPVIVEAACRWARTVRGAPRTFAPLLTRVVGKDEVISRVFTAIVRRELQGAHASSQERRVSLPRVRFEEVDPFAYTPESLIAATSHIEACATCHATGTAACPGCRASGRASCSNCGGTGRFRNPSTNRMNNCKVCKTTGEVPCARCSGGGRVACETCGGSGHQRVWLSFVESRRAHVAIKPDTPTKVAHRQLTEPRILASQEMGAFTLQIDRVEQGPVTPSDFDADARAVLQAEMAKVDRRLERVVQQQFMRFAVPRRDVCYQMCGVTGVLALSGRELAGATTPEAVRPIRRRNLLTPVIVLALSLVSIVPAGTMMGSSRYFSVTNSIAVWTWLGTVLVSIPWIGGALRAWRPARQWGGLTGRERAFGVAWAVALLAMFIGGALIRPKVEHVADALASSDVNRARLVLEALREREGASLAVGEAEDAVLLAEAKNATGEERREKLDLVASHHGTHAESAAAIARTERLQEVRSLVESGRPDEVIATIDHLYAANWRMDPEVAEERARAHDLRHVQCSDDICRLLEARAAHETHESPTRAALIQEVRGRIQAQLKRRDVSGATSVERLHKLEEFLAAAQRAAVAVADDKELASTALAASVWVDQERGKFAAIGADWAVLAALFPELRRAGAEVVATSIEGIDVFFELDADGLCEGMYAVGPVGRRTLHSPTWSADRLLSQALGRPATVRRPAKPSETGSTWTESGKKVVVRWRDGEPVELRIGTAKP